jgi:hypothetical protein
MPAASIQARPAAESCQTEMLHAHRNGTFKVPAGTSKAQLVGTINATAHTYEGIPG